MHLRKHFNTFGVSPTLYPPYTVRSNQKAIILTIHLSRTEMAVCSFPPLRSKTTKSNKICVTTRALDNKTKKKILLIWTTRNNSQRQKRSNKAHETRHEGKQTFIYNIV